MKSLRLFPLIVIVVILFGIFILPTKALVKKNEIDHFPIKQTTSNNHPNSATRAIIPGVDIRLSSEGAAGPDIAISNNGQFIALTYFRDSGFVHIKSATLSDGWLTTTALGAGSNPQLSFHPTTNNLVYVVWQNANSRAIEYARCTLSAANSPSCVTGVVHSSTSIVENPTVVVDSSGNVHAAWTGTSGNLETAWSTNQGGTWATPISLASGSNNFRRPQLAFANGILHLAYVLENPASTPPNEGERIEYRRTTGLTSHSWGSPTGSFGPGAGVFSGYHSLNFPTIVANGTNVYLAWEAHSGNNNTVNNDFGLIKAESNDGGVNWQSPVRYITSDAAATGLDITTPQHKTSRSSFVGSVVPIQEEGLRPSLVISGTGYAAVWQQRPDEGCPEPGAGNGTSEIYYSLKGASWSGPDTLANNSNQYSIDPDLAVSPANQARHFTFMKDDSQVVGCQGGVSADYAIYYRGPFTIVEKDEGEEPVYSISGRITDDSNPPKPISGVTVSTPSGKYGITGPDGTYTITGLTAGLYEIMVAEDGYVYSPPKRSVLVPDEVDIEQNFVRLICSSKWLAVYYDNRDLSGIPKFVRCDQDIDFYWGEKKPDDSIPADNFSVRWMQTVEIPEDGWYHFRAFTDDGLRLYVDGERIIDDWVARSFTEKSAFKKLTQGSHQVVMEYVEWSNDAMARLSWYRSLLCPDNAIECTSNVTPMYQTSYLDQPMPSICTSGPNQTIAAYGCKITSIAMALQTYGINTTPQDLNDWLSGEHPDTKIKPRGYRTESRGVGDPCSAFLVEDQIIEFAEEKGVRLKWVQYPDAQDVLMNKKLPVIMSVNDTNHYVLATDIVKTKDTNNNLVETLGIYDPHHTWVCEAINKSSTPPSSKLTCTTGVRSKHATTVLEENRNYPGGALTKPRQYLEYQTEPRTPSLQFFISGVEVLLSDQQNNQVGYESTTGEFIHEISNSAYYDAEIVPPGAQPNETIERSLLVSENADGVYRLLVIPPDVNVNRVTPATDLEFSIGIIGHDGEFNPLETTASGTLSFGKTLEYEINYSPGQGLSLTKVDSQEIYLPIIIK